MKVSLAVALLANMASAKMGLGPCPEVEAMTDLDVERFAGNWYQISRDA